MRRRRTILVVEDHPVVRQGLSALFTREGFAVFAGRDGEEGFSLAGRHRPDLIVSDLAMGHGGGLRLLERIRKDAILKDVPFVMLTARHAALYADVCLRAGASAFVEKVDVQEVLAAARRALAAPGDARA